MHGTLNALQVNILEVLADLEPPWTLVGGAALAGLHLKHRATRDLDLFWRQREKLGELAGFFMIQHGRTSTYTTASRNLVS